VTRIYHGWRVVAALFLAGFMVYGGGLYCFVLFVPRITEELGWSRAATSGLVSAFWLTAPLILLGGYAIKRAGILRLLVGGIIIEAICVSVLALVSSLWQMYLLRILMGLGKVMFAVTLPYAVSRWFRRRYALALAVAWAGWHVGGLVLSPVAATITAHYGWRTACMSIGGGLLTIGLLPVLAALRVRSPAALGLGLDGDAPGDGDGDSDALHATAAGADGATAGTLREVLVAPVFWLIAAVTVFFYTTYGGLLAHEAAVVEAVGFSPAVASVVLGSMAGVAAASGLAAGWLLDRGAIRAVGVGVHAVLLIGAGALIAVTRMPSVVALATYAGAFGIAIGAGDLYFVALLRHRFPRVSVAYLYSAWYFCELATLLVAPIAAGKVYDLTGNYARTLLLLAASAAVALGLGLLALRARPDGRGADAPA
jgi:cyanate permease